MTLNGEYIQSVVITHLWQMTAVIAAVGVLSFFTTRRWPHLTFLLWVAAFLKCVIPPVVESPLSVFGSSVNLDDSMHVALSHVEVTGTLKPQPHATPETERTAEEKTSTDVATHRSGATPTGEDSLQSWSSFAIGLFTWATGALLLAGLTAFRWWSLRIRLARSRIETPDRVLEHIEEVRRKLKMRRRFEVVVTSSNCGPSVFGMWRPTLIIPSSLVNSLQQGELRAVLTHEIVHARRGDTLWGNLQLIIQIVWWFHPLVWWMNRRANEACERCCDIEAVATLQCSPREYAESLIAVLELRSEIRPVAAMYGIRSADLTSDRLETLVKRTEFRMRTPIRCWIALFLVSIATIPVAAQNSVRPAGPASEIQNLKNQGDKAFANQDWKTAAKAYSELTEANKKDGRSWFRLGYALHADGRLEEAIKAHEKASRFPGARTVALYNWACALARLGEHEEALARLEEAVEAGFISQMDIAKDADLKSVVSMKKFEELRERSKPPAQRSVYRQFDFWVGNWDVFNKSGTKVGTNVITKDERGFLITEKWTNSTGSTGTSINFYDPGDKQWKQTWIDAGGGVVRYAGAFSDGKMKLKGESTLATGRKELSRVTFTPRPNGSVRQFIERSTDNGRTWTVYFDGTYIRRKSVNSKT